MFSHAKNLGLCLLASTLALSSFVGSARAEAGGDAQYAELSRQLAESKQRVRILEERLRQLDARRREGLRPEPALRTGVECVLPFFLDRAGLKHLRPECAMSQSAASCEQPFVLDAEGIKRVRPACVPATAPASSD